MKKRGVRCWKAEAECDNGEKVEVYFTVSDFYQADKLFTCLSCSALFAVDPDREYYSGVPFEQLCQQLTCPVCGSPLKDLVEYPKTFSCAGGKEVGHYSRFDRSIPPDDQSVVQEFWDPYST
jgi:rubredoxin